MRTANRRTDQKAAADDRLPVAVEAPDDNVPVLAILVTVLAALLAGYAYMQVATTPFSHDGHLSIASAVLVGDGLLPYRDSPFRQTAQTIADRVGEGRVLSLAPGMALEASLNVHSELATGTFPWRVSGQLPPKQARRCGVHSARAHPGLLAGRPPHAVPAGAEPGQDLIARDQTIPLGQSLVTAAQDLRLVPIQVPASFLKEGLFLWW